MVHQHYILNEQKGTKTTHTVVIQKLYSLHNRCYTSSTAHHNSSPHIFGSTYHEVEQLTWNVLVVQLASVGQLQLLDLGSL